MRKPSSNFRRRMSGLTLVELMIALVLGLVVVAGVGSVMLANRQTYSTNQALSEMQESVRSAFELLSYDIRQAGGTPCGNTLNFANTVKPSSGPSWWQSMEPIIGFDGNQISPSVAFSSNANNAESRVSGTDAITLTGTDPLLDVTVAEHQVNEGGPDAVLRITNPTPNIISSDILLVCDFKQTTVLQVSQYNSGSSAPGSSSVVINTGGSQSPGNCTKQLLGSFDCSANQVAPQNPKATDKFDANQTFISRPTASTWYIGHNARPDDGGRSLYRVFLQHRPTRQLLTAEIVSGVTDMQLRYKTRTSSTFVSADSLASPGDWATVDAVEVTLTLQSTSQGVSTSSANQGRLSRQVSTVVAIRNRVE